MRRMRMERSSRVAAAALTAVFVLGAMAPVRAQADEGTLTQIGRIIPRFTFQTRFLEVDPSARRLFEIGQPVDGNGMALAAYDLDSLKHTKTITITDAQSGFGGKLTALDELRHRLYVLFPMRLTGDEQLRGVLGRNSTLLDQGTRTMFALAVVDTLRVKLLGVRVLPDLFAAPIDQSNSNFVGVKAMSYFPHEEKLYVLTEDTSARLTDIVASDHIVFVHELDASAALDEAMTSIKTWSYPVPQCPMAMARKMASVVMRSAYQRAVLFPCRAGDILGIGLPGEIGGMVRVNLRDGAVPSDTSNFTTDFFPISGNLQTGVVAIDPVSERFFLGADTNELEPRVWVFDSRSASWIGLIVTPTFWAVAIDRAFGRIYTLSPSFGEGDQHIESVVASTRSADADQGVLVSWEPHGAPDIHRPVVDPVRHRIFWPGHDDYFVIQDTIPPRREAAPSDPDANTVDVAQGPRTAANFFGGGRGFGTRMRLVGGWRAFEKNYQAVYPPLVDTARTFIDGSAAPGTPSEGTRDFHLGRVMQVALSNGEATAEATSADRDRNTDADLFRWTSWLAKRRAPDLTQQRWPYAPVACADFGREPDHAEARGANASCDRDALKVSASARSMSPVELPAPPGQHLLPKIVIGDSTTSASSRIDRTRGVVSVARSEVRGIEIDGRIGIGRVVAVAESWATGRPKRSNGIGAGSSYSRTIEDVWVRGDDGSRTVLCQGPCNPQVVADAMTKVLGARVRIDLPEPDRPLARGTDGGYESLIVRAAAERENDRWLNEESDNRLEVPAMVVTFFLDGRVPSRLVLSLAGVSVESHYGIYLLARETAGPPPPVRAVPPPPPAADDVPIDTRPPVRENGGPSTVLRKVIDGVTFVLASPSQALRALALWVFLIAPLRLIVRRRFLARVRP